MAAARVRNQLPPADSGLAVAAPRASTLTQGRGPINPGGNEITQRESPPPADSRTLTTSIELQVPQPSPNDPAIPPSGRSPQHLMSWALAAGVLALLVLIAFSDVHLLWQTAVGVDPWLLLMALFCAVVSYLTMTRSYQGIAWAAGAHVGFGGMLRITVVANTVNYLVSTGGLSGFAVRMYFFIRMAMPSGTAVVISLIQTFITNLILLFCVVVGFWYLVSQHRLNGFALVSSSVLLTISVTASILAIVLLAHRRLRRRTLFLACEGLHWFLHRFLPRHKPARVRLWRFQRNLNRGIDFLLERKRLMVVPVLWIVADWVATIGILYVAFIAVGHPLPAGLVMVGFSIGVVLSAVSLVPGGLGIMEGSMAAIFRSFSVPLESAVIAVLIFRLAYYVFPAVVSLFFFRGMLIQGARGASELAEA